MRRQHCLCGVAFVFGKILSLSHWLAIVYNETDFYGEQQ